MALLLRQPVALTAHRVTGGRFDAACDAKSLQDEGLHDKSSVAVPMTASTLSADILYLFYWLSNKTCMSRLLLMSQSIHVPGMFQDISTKLHTNQHQMRFVLTVALSRDGINVPASVSRPPLAHAPNSAG